MHASKLVWFAMPRIARPTILLLVLVSGCRPRFEDVAGGSSVTTYAGEAGAVTSFSDYDSLEPASVSEPIAVDFPLGALPPEQRQLAELSTILAFREFHRSFPPAPEWEWIPNPPEPPPEQFALHNRVGHVRMVNVFGEWITMVELFGAKDYPRRVNEVLNFRWTTPFGLQFDNPPSESILATLQEKGPERLAHIAVRCHGLSEESFRILSELPHVKSIDFLYGITNEQLRLVLRKNHFESVRIVLSPEFDTQQMSFLSDLTNLKRLEIGKRHPGHPHHSMAPLFEVLAKMPQMEFIRIKDGQISREAVEGYLKGFDHANLKTLDIATQELHRSTVERFSRLTGIEELRAVVSPYSVIPAVQSLRWAGAGKSLRKLELVPCGAEKNQPVRRFSGDSVPELVAAISGLTNLEELLVPLQIESPRFLEPLTRMPHLRRVQVGGLVLNREALAILGRMSHLNDITVESLDFGPECAHLLPWLTVRRIHIEQPVTLTDERAYLLALCPQLQGVTWWGHSGLTRRLSDIPRDIPHIWFRGLD